MYEIVEPGRKGPRIPLTQDDGTACASAHSPAEGKLHARPQPAFLATRLSTFLLSCPQVAKRQLLLG